MAAKIAAGVAAAAVVTAVCAKHRRALMQLLGQPHARAHKWMLDWRVRQRKNHRLEVGLQRRTMMGGRHVEETAEKSGPPRAGDHGEPGEAATGDG